MNRNQKISLIGFFIGLTMILNLIVYGNNYTLYIVTAGFILSLSCALAYSLFQYIPITPENEKNVDKNMKLDDWMRERDTAERALSSNIAVLLCWKGVQTEAEQEIERILRA